MDTNNNQDTAQNNADLQHWQNAESYQQNETTDHEEVDLRSAEAGGYGLDKENAYDAASASDKDHEDKDDDDNDNDNDNDDDDDDDAATMDDWGDVDPASGDAPTAPGSAV
jgi:hypothetical protein